MHTEPEIIESVEMGNIERVAEILALNKDAHSELDSMGFSALHAATSSSDLEMVQLLLNSGADPNIENRSGITPLHIAQDIAIIDALIAHGAKIEHRSKDGRTPLRVFASEANTFREMKRLLELGADPNASDNWGMSSVGIANERGEKRKVVLLKHYGATM